MINLYIHKESRERYCHKQELSEYNERHAFRWHVSHLRLPFQRLQDVESFRSNDFATVNNLLSALHKPVCGRYSLHQVVLGGCRTFRIVVKIDLEVIHEIQLHHLFVRNYRRVRIEQIAVCRARRENFAELSAFRLSAAHHSHRAYAAVVHGSQFLRAHHSGRINVVQTAHHKLNDSRRCAFQTTRFHIVQKISHLRFPHRHILVVIRLEKPFHTVAFRRQSGIALINREIIIGYHLLVRPRLVELEIKPETFLARKQISNQQSTYQNKPHPYNLALKRNFMITVHYIQDNFMRFLRS